MAHAVNNYGVPGMSLNSSPLLMSTGNESMLHSHGNGMFGSTTSPSGLFSGLTLGNSMEVTAATSRSGSTGFSAADDNLTDPALVDPHIAYYFESVVSMQYVFGTEAARGVLQNVSTVPDRILVSVLTNMFFDL